MGLFDRVDDSRQGRVARRCRDPILQRPGLVNGAGKDLVASSLVHWQALTGNRRLVNGGLPADHLAIEPDTFARAHAHQGTEGNVLDVQFLPLTIGLLHGGHVRGQLHQATDGIAGPVQ
ncbi:hypothetical protein D9M71_128280 [compost metagenome]